MKAYRVHSPHIIKLDEMEALPVGAICVKLKNLMCGISSADISVYSGKRAVQYPIIPVRQCVGFVSEVGSDVTRIARGNRVVTYPHASCHACKACKEARFAECEKAALFGVAENGFLSDFSVVSASDVYPIPEWIKDDEAVFIEDIAMAINTINTLDVEKGEHIVIVGATVVGLILAQVAMYYQAVPIVVDMRSELLALAQKSGVYFTVNAVNDDVSKKILALTGGHMADACAYFVDSGLPVHNVFDYTVPHGKIALVGRMTGAELNCNLNTFMEKNLNLTTVTDCGKNYPAAINMLANHTVKVDDLFERVVAFDQVPELYEQMSAAGNDNVLKMLVKI